MGRSKTPISTEATPSLPSRMRAPKCTGPFQAEDAYWKGIENSNTEHDAKLIPRQEPPKDDGGAVDPNIEKIEVGEKKKGLTAEEKVIQYSFDGIANIPVLVVLRKEKSGPSFFAEILDSIGRRLQETTSDSRFRTQNVVHAPNQRPIHNQMKGRKDYGEFTVQLSRS